MSVGKADTFNEYQNMRTGKSVKARKFSVARMKLGAGIIIKTKRWFKTKVGEY